MDHRDALLQIEDALRCRIGVRDIGQMQHRDDVCAVLVADRRHARGRIQIEVPVRHHQTALQQNRRVPGGVVEIGGSPQPEQIRCVEIGVVERIDVGPQRPTQRSCQLMPIRQGGNPVECRLQGRQAPGFDPRLIHVCGVVVAHFARFTVRRRLRGLLQQLVGLLLCALGDHRERAVVGPVRRDLHLLEPPAVGVAEKVIARRGREAHAAQAGGRADEACGECADAGAPRDPSASRRPGTHHIPSAHHSPNSLKPGCASGRRPGGQ